MRKMKSRPDSPPPSKTPQRAPHTVSLHRRATASRLMAQGANALQVAEILQEQDPTLGDASAAKLYTSVLAEWTRIHEAEIPHHRAMQLQGLRQDLVTMYAERTARELPKGRRRATWADIIRVKREIAKITGTYSPIKLEVTDPHERFKSNVNRILEEMSPEDQAALIAEGEAIEG